MTDQTATMNGSTLLNLSYRYDRNNSVGSLNGKTGHLTKIIDNLNSNKNREYEFDALGRLTKAKGGSTGTLWNQTYTYDRYGNRTSVTASGTAADSSPIPIDGIPNLSYDDATNRITTSGYEYDVAGNMIKGLAEDGVTELKYEYDAANRLQVVRKNDVNQTQIEGIQYGSTNARLIKYDALGTGFNHFYAAVGGTVMAEYAEIYGVFTWTKSYTYLGDTQLATITPGSGGETLEFNHPDRLGTRLKTDQTAGTSKEQVHLPFGTALNAESTVTDNNKRFTSYDRSPSTGLDYALNRTYDSKLGRFTQVDPIGMQSVSLGSPQSLNLYSYCLNDSVNFTDPSGLFLGRFFRWLGRVIMSLFRSGVARRIAVRFVVSYVTSGFNLGVAFRSVAPEILRQLGLNPNPLLTPSWNPNLRYPISFGVGSLSRHIIVNFARIDETADLIALALSRALDILAMGCWKPGTNNRVKPYTDEFATMNIWDAVKWKDAYSTHDSRAKQSPIVLTKKFTATIPITRDRTMAAKMGSTVESTIVRNYVVKFYSQSDTAAVTYPNEDFDHYVAAAGFTLGAKTNGPIAKEFINASKDMECK